MQLRNYGDYNLHEIDEPTMVQLMKLGTHLGPATIDGTFWQCVLVNSGGNVFVMRIDHETSRCYVQKTELLDPQSAGVSIAAQLRDPSLASKWRRQILDADAVRWNGVWVEFATSQLGKDCGHTDQLPTKIFYDDDSLLQAFSGDTKVGTMFIREDICFIKARRGWAVMREAQHLEEASTLEDNPSVGSIRRSLDLARVVPRMTR